MKTLKIHEHEGFTYRSRIVNDLGTPVVQANVSTIIFQLWVDGPGADNEHPVYVRGYEASDVLSDSLTTGWDEDSVGWNLEIKVPGRAMQHGANSYTGEIVVLRPGDSPIATRFRVDVMAMRTEGSF